MTGASGRPQPAAGDGMVGCGARADSSRASRRYVDMAWGQVHLTTAGQGPPVLFVHSMPRSADEFRGVLGRIPARRCLAVDLPGLGASDPLPVAASIDGYARALWEVCDRLGADPVSIVGHHGGGVVAVEMVAQQPGRVERLVLSSTPWLGPREREERKAAGVYYGFAPSDDLAHLHLMADRRRPWMPKGRPQLWNGVIVDVLRAADPEAPLRALARYHMEDRIDRVACPTLVVARRNDIWYGQREVLASRLPHADIEVIDGTVLVEDRPDAFVTAVTSFLCGPEARGGDHPPATAGPGGRARAAPAGKAAPAAPGR